MIIWDKFMRFMVIAESAAFQYDMGRNSTML